MVALAARATSRLEYEPEYHLVYEDGDLSVMYFPSTDNVLIRRTCDGSDVDQCMVLNFSRLDDMVDYVRRFRARTFYMGA